ncbi:MAG: hypothetical protein H0X34_15750 [Chthoniobacterales bacterium]|nr:hypothetical protein [Chthoniobacterales bacterium]
MYEQIQINQLKPSGRNLFDWSPSRRGCIPAALALALAWIVVSPTARAERQHRTEAIPTATPQKGMMRFSASTVAWITRRLGLNLNIGAVFAAC